MSKDSLSPTSGGGSPPLVTLYKGVDADECLCEETPLLYLSRLSEFISYVKWRLIWDFNTWKRNSGKKYMPWQPILAFTMFIIPSCLLHCTRFNPNAWQNIRPRSSSSSCVNSKLPIRNHGHCTTTTALSITAMQPWYLITNNSISLRGLKWAGPAMTRMCFSFASHLHSLEIFDRPHSAWKTSAGPHLSPRRLSPPRGINRAGLASPRVCPCATSS